MNKRIVSKEEYEQIIDEILHCRYNLAKTFDIYTANTIDRLIMARVKIAQITISHKPIPILQSISKASDGGKKEAKE
jgi:hypothetical protein